MQSVPFLRRCLAPLAVIACLLTTPEPAFAFVASPGLRLNIDESLLVTWHFSRRYPTFTDSRDQAVVASRLRLEIASGQAVAGLRLDGTWFSSDMADPARSIGPLYDNALALDRYWLRWRTRSLRIEAGDSYLTLGRGLALSLRKDDELGTDTTLQGAVLEGDFGPVRPTLFAGFSNILDTDPVTDRRFLDPRDLIAGFGMQADVAPGLRLAGHGLHLLFAPLLSDRLRQTVLNRDTSLAGVSLAWSGKSPFYLSVYGEYDFLYARLRRVDETAGRPGHAGYLSLLIEPARGLSLHLELVLYDDFFVGRYRAQNQPSDPVEIPDGLSYAEDIVYNAAPSLENPDVELKQPYNRGGGRLRAELTPSGDFPGTLFTSLALFRPQPSAAGESRLEWHAQAGIDNFGPDGLRLHADGGYRQERSLDRSLEHAGLAHASVGGQIQLPGRHSLEWDGLYRLRRSETGRDRHETEATLGWSLAGVVSLSAGYGWQTPVGGVSPHYWNYSLTTRFWQAVSLSVTGGRLMGGIRCAGGQCRYLPPFEGVKTMLGINL